MTTSDILSIIAAVSISVGAVVSVIIWHILSRRRAKNNDNVNAVGKDGYTVIQCLNNHIQIYKDDRLVYHASCTKKMTEEELKEQVDFLKAIREGKDEG